VGEVPDDPWMLDPREEARLALESIMKREASGDELDRALGARLEISAPPHLAHPALPRDGVEDESATEDVTGPSHERELIRSSPARPLQEGAMSPHRHDGATAIR